MNCPPCFNRGRGGWAASALFVWFLIGFVAAPSLLARAGSDRQPDSPVAKLRELLRADPANREALLANRTVRQKRLIEDGLVRLGRLTADEREIQFKVMELRFHLLPLMKLTAVERGDSLQGLSVELRRSVEGRLRLWDQLPKEVQEEVLEFGSSTAYFGRLERSSPSDRLGILARVPEKQRAQIESKLARWEGLSLEQREEIQDRFKRFFDLTEVEKNKTLKLVSDAELSRVKAAIRTFELLHPEHRDTCLSALEEFSKMSVDQQSQFLRNADRWQAMSESQRKAWRQIMNQHPPQPPRPPLRSSRAVPPIPGERE